MGSRLPHACVFALSVLLGLGCPATPETNDAVSVCADTTDARDTLMFHGNRQREGWYANEPALRPDAVASRPFGHLWDSPPLDSVTLGTRTIEPHIYATPLYKDGVVVSAGPHTGKTLSLVFVATTSGWAYAINAFSSPCDRPEVLPGAIVWSTRLGTPRMTLGRPNDTTTEFDGGIPLGTLSTPVIDTASDPPRLYLTALDATVGWQAFALDLRSGEVLAGWPVPITAATVGPVNKNPPAVFPAPELTTQRSALALSPDGAHLYVGFSSAAWIATGWMIAVDTRQPRIAAAFSTAPTGTANGRGGIWGSGGPAVDADGSVYVTTGNGVEHVGDAVGHWADSLLRWGPSLDLTGTYSPFNYCTLDDHDMDLAASSPIIVDLDPATTSTPHLLAFGGKQGAAYLLDRDHLPGRLDRRPPCNIAPIADGSLLAPEDQPQFSSRGPLQVFRPWSPDLAWIDYARMHTTLATYRDGSGTFVYLSGASKQTADIPNSVAPGLFRLRVVAHAGQPAYLAISDIDMTTTLVNPGSPVITSDGSTQPVVWVLDSNQPRSAHLVVAEAKHPVLYAFDGSTLRPLWRSGPDELFVGGKYSSPTVAHGVVFVGTDRVQAFGLH